MSSNPSTNSSSSPSPDPAPGGRTVVTGEGSPDTSISAQFVTEPQSVADGSVLIGQSLGRYRIRSVVGVGGMGIVCRARDELIARDVALKVLPKELASNSAMVERFLSEARAAGKLSHPNAVAIHEVGESNGIYYLVMELVTGGSVAELLKKESRFSLLEATRIIAEAASGLSAAHAAGLVHRDIKPANLLMSETGSIKVADFGLVKSIVSDQPVTQAGQVLGTPYFMSPEQCEAKPVDGRSDIYSLGATYYMLLTGVAPYADSGNTVQIMYAHCHSEPLDPRKTNPAIPEACSAIVQRATAKLPAERYQTMGQMLSDLNAVIATLSGAVGILLPSQSGSRAAIRTAVAPARLWRRRIAVTGSVVAGLLLISGLIAAIVFFSWGRNDEKQPLDRPVIAAPTGEPIKVGLLHSLTGTMSSSSTPVMDATLLAIEEVNASGGLLGRPVVPVIADGQSDPHVDQTEARRLLEEEHVCTIFGCWTSSGRKMVIPVIEQYKNLLIYPVQYEGLEESPCVIYNGAAPNQQLIPAVKWAFAFGNKRRFFLIGSDYVFPRVANAIIHDQLKQLGGTIVGEDYVPLGSTNVEAIIKRIVAAKPDVILNTINGDTNLIFFRALRAAGFRANQIPTISFSISSEEMRHMDIGSMVGDYAAWNYFQSIKSPENEKFVNRFRARYGPTRVLTDPMEAAYFGVHLWAQAVKKAQSIDPKAIREAIRGQRYLAPEGEVTIDSETGHTYKTPRIGQLRADGTFEIVWTDARPEAPHPFPLSRSRDEWKALLAKLQKNWNGEWSAPSLGR